MKVLISIAMLIVFISAFFVFFTFDVVIEDYLKCSHGGDCEVEVPGVSLLLGLSIIGVFVILSGGAVYIVYKIVLKSGTPYAVRV
jgi:hypothetical protein